MAKRSLFLGLDVHAETIAVAVAEGVRGGEVRSLGVIPNTPQAIRKLIKKLGEPSRIHACYEAGPCGYAVYWQLTELGVDCAVVAPTLVPVKAGDRVKTDRRDAAKLARSHRAGDLTAVWVPDPAHEALRDLVRAREVAKRDQLRARQRLDKFLLRQGLRRPAKTNAWTGKHLEWIRRLTLEHRPQQAVLGDYLAEVDHAADRSRRLEQSIDDAIEKLPPETRALVAGLQALRGVAQLTAVSVVAEIGRFQRFGKASQLMGYSGIVPSEHSSGAQVARGRITRTGNAHLRRVLVEAAWCCRHRPARGYALKKRQEGLTEPVKEIAWKAQHRLHRRYWKLLGAGKPKQKVVTAVARELLGFIWAIGVAIEQDQATSKPRTRAAA